jgi:hypothetical protein
MEILAMVSEFRRDLKARIKLAQHLAEVDSDPDSPFVKQASVVHAIRPGGDPSSMHIPIDTS